MEGEMEGDGRLLRTRTEMTPRAIRPGAAVMEGEMEGDGR